METDEFGFALNYDSSDDNDVVDNKDPDPIHHPSNIYAPENGSTLLYQLIRSGNQRRILELIDAYGADFAKVRKHLERKYRWKSDDKIWLRKTILVAWSEEQCRRAKGLENKVEDLQKAVFVLLQYPADGEEVAILHPDESSRLTVAQLIIDLIPNGFLTWKNITSDGKTFMEAAAGCGLHEIIDKLFELGDPIAIPNHNPLIEACAFDRKDTIQWLLTKHFDDFDCTLRDGSQYNALIVALRRNDPKMVQLLLGKMVAYRQKHYQESESEAFSQIFRYESEDSDASIFNFIWRSKKMYEVVEKAITDYKLDLSYRWKDVTNLENLISYGIALDYCFEGIRANPELLGLETSKSTTILDELLNKRHLDFLNEVCRKHPTTKRYKRIELFQEFFPNFKDEIEQTRIEKVDQQICTEMPSAEIQPEHHPIVHEDQPSKPTLHEAVQADDLELFLHLLETGHDIDALDNDGNHPVHFVQSEAMLDLMISRHPDGPKIVHRTDPAGFSLLHKICSLRMDHKTMIDLMERVIGYGADVHQVTKNGESIVFFVEDCEVLKYLRKFEVKLDVVNVDGETALERHLYNENFNVARKLLVLTYRLETFKDHGHNILDLMMKKPRYYFTQHYQDLLEKHPEMTRIIFDALYNKSREKASQLFAKATRNGFYFIVEKFLDFGYDLNYDFIYKEHEGDEESTPLLNLLSSSEILQVRLIEQLLEKDVDVHFRNSSSRNALLELVYRYRFVNSKRKEDVENLVRLLIKRGSSVDCVDSFENTALHWAFYNSRLELVMILIRMGADFRVKNNGGRISLEMADNVTQELFNFLS